jgi:hypothetical protein
MSLESRKRMVSFRLTEEEYERFRRVCMSRGLRNVSELVRAAVTQLTDDQPSSPSEVPADPDLHARVAKLETHLAELAIHFGRMENKLGNNHISHAQPAQLARSASGQ